MTTCVYSYGLKCLLQKYGVALTRCSSANLASMSAITMPLCSRAVRLNWCNRVHCHFFMLIGNIRFFTLSQRYMLLTISFVFIYSVSTCPFVEPKCSSFRIRKITLFTNFWGEKIWLDSYGQIVSGSVCSCFRYSQPVAPQLSEHKKDRLASKVA